MTRVRSTVLEALLLAALGFFPIPLVRGTKRPPFKTGPGHAHVATRDPDVLRSWFARDRFDIGVVLHLSGHVAPDVDVKHSSPGLAALRQLEEQTGLCLRD